MLHFVLLWIVLPTLYLGIFGLILRTHPVLGEHIQKTFTDSLNKPSYTRMASFIAEIAVLLWVTHIVWAKLEIPNLTNCLVLIGGLNALDQLPSILLSLRGIKPDQPRDISTPTTSPGSPLQS